MLTLQFKPAIIILFGWMLVLTACTFKDKRFKSKTTIHAPNSGVTVIVDGKGVVPPNYDMGMGTAQVVLQLDRQGESFTFWVNEESIIWNLRQQGQAIQPLDSANVERSLFALLNTVEGFDYDKEEMENLVDRIIGVFYGPKGTALNGPHKGLNISETTVVSYLTNGDSLVYH